MWSEFREIRSKRGMTPYRVRSETNRDVVIAELARIERALSTEHFDTEFGYPETQSISVMCGCGRRAVADHVAFVR